MTSTSVFEEFLLAEDKNAYLESIKTSNEYRNLMIHYCLNNNIDLPDHLKNSVTKNYGDRNLYLKKTLIDLERETDETKRAEILKELNSQVFYFGFNDVRSTGARNIQQTENQEGQKIDNSTLKTTFTDFAKNLESLYSGAHELYETSFNIIGRGNMKKIDILRLQHPRSQTALLRALPNYLHFENLGQIFKSVKENYDKMYSEHNDIFRVDDRHLSKMSVDQIRQVADTLNISNSIQILKKLFTIQFHREIDQSVKAHQRKEYEKVREFIVQFRTHIQGQPEYNELDKILVKCLVFNSIKRRNPDIDLTFQLIENPTTDSYWYLFKQDLKEQHRNTIFVPLSNEWVNLFSYLYENRNDQNLHSEVLSLSLKTEDDLRKFLKYFSEDALRPILLRNQTQDGGPIEAYIKYFGQGTADTMVNQKILKLTDQNRTEYRPGDKVEVSVMIKNIEKLEVKIFRVDIVNYLKKNKSYPDHNLDLTGLIPEKCQKYTYDNEKHHHHEETFKFTELDDSDTGFYIIDFVGDGLMSRAVIRKGSYSLFSSPYEYGYRFFILDQNKNICKGADTGIYVDGKLLSIDEEGAICIPYDSSVFQKDCVLIHNNYGYLGNVLVSNENYNLRTALIFNDEGILPGRKARLILRNKLFLNNVPISIKKVKEATVLLDLVNLEGITNNKVFENVELQDNSDYVVEFIVPNKLTQIRVQVVTKIETVGQGEISRVNSETVSITRGENNYKIQNGFLEETNEGYFFFLKGRNGEPLADKPVEVHVKRITDQSVNSDSLTTNDKGMLTLGKLEGVKSVKFTFEEGELISCINNSSIAIDIPTSFHICQGEELCLPSTGMELNTRNFNLVQWNAENDVLKDCFENLKSIDDGKNILIQGLTVGKYRFYYFGIEYKTISIEVKNAKRWEHSPLVIESEDTLRTVTGEIRYLDISNINQTEENLEINLVSNDLENSVVHVFAYHYNPRLVNFMSTKLASTSASRSEETFTIERPGSTYISEKQLGDEMRYVMDRKSKTSFIGNTLKKPSILLHRKFIKETTEDEEKLRTEGDFDRASMLKSSACRRMANDYYNERMMKEESYRFNDFYTGYNVVSTHEYIANSGKTLPNLKPDENGRISIPLSQIKNYSEVAIIAADTYGNVMNRASIGNSKTSHVDLRLAEAKEAGIIYAEDRFCLTNQEGGDVVIDDMKNTQSYIIEDLKSLFDALMVISTVNKVEINKWKFLVNWGRLSEEEKLKKFDEFGGHELNIFTYLKDREFFDRRIKPILKYKSESQMIDFILTGKEAEFENRFTLDTVTNISPLELVLLLDYYKESKPELCEKVVQSLKMRLETRKVSQAERNSKFDSIIASKKIDEEPEFSSDADDDECDECEEIEYCEKEEECMDFAAFNDMEMDIPVMAMAEMPMAPPPPAAPQFSMAPPPMAMPRGLHLGAMSISTTSKPVVIERYKKAGAAFEYGERHQFFNSSPANGEINFFWLEIAERILKSGKNTILTENFMETINRDFMIIYSLAFTDLPFKAGKLDSITEGQALKITSTENFLVICKKMEEKTTERLQMDLIVSQKFYDPNDMYSYDEKDSSIKRLKEANEFLIGKRYSSRITFTNVSENYLQLKVIVQIPQGAMPLYNLDILKIHSVDVNSLSTQILSFDFYFPSVGEFSCYPATIVKNNRLVAHSTISDKLRVVAQFERGDKQLDSLQDILNYGSEEDILKFMEEKNLFNSNLFNISKVLWLFREKENYQKAITILRNKCFFDTRAWSYSIQHGDYETFLELVRNTSHLKNSLTGLNYFQSKFVRIDTYQPLEYDPLINPRAHSLSDKKHNILNKNFKETYEKFLRYLTEKPQISARDTIILTAYFVLQDRVEEALKLSKTINDEEVRENKIMLVQYDYIKAYLSIYEEYPKFPTARQVCKNYSDFSDITWRKMFNEIQSQLDEFDGAQGGQVEEDDSKIKHASNKELTEKAEYLKAETKKETNDINVTYMNIPSITVNFFKLDMEILFSNDPFLEKNTGNFSFVNPNAQRIIEVAPTTDFANTVVEIPEELKNSSLFVFVQGGSKSTSLKVFNSNLKARAIEDFGMIKVADNEGKLLSKIYVKCFYKPKSGGQAKFYKDGYTDFRGSFDYASLNSDSLDKVDKFSILVVDDEYGATILEAVPPRKVGQIGSI